MRGKHISLQNNLQSSTIEIHYQIYFLVTIIGKVTRDGEVTKLYKPVLDPNSSSFEAKWLTWLVSNALQPKRDSRSNFMARFQIFPSSQLHNSLHRPNPIPNIFGPPSPGFRESKEDLIVPKFRDRIEI